MKLEVCLPFVVEFSPMPLPEVLGWAAFVVFGSIAMAVGQGWLEEREWRKKNHLKHLR